MVKLRTVKIFHQLSLNVPHWPPTPSIFVVSWIWQLRWNVMWFCCSCCWCCQPSCMQVQDLQCQGASQRTWRWRRVILRSALTLTDDEITTKALWWRQTSHSSKPAWPTNQLSLRAWVGRGKEIKTMRPFGLQVDSECKPEYAWIRLQCPVPSMNLFREDLPPTF